MPPSNLKYNSKHYSVIIRAFKKCVNTKKSPPKIESFTAMNWTLSQGCN